MKSVFISDLHLSGDQPEIFQAFKKFLHDLPVDVTQLFILGDLFEVWVGDDDPSPFAAKVISTLKNISMQGIKLYVQPGNRDFMLGKRFSKATGAILLPDYYLFEQGNLRALLTHGDILCTDDEDYQKFRAKVRNPVIQTLLRLLPLSYRQNKAKEWRAKSKAMNQNKPANIMDVNAEAVGDCMKKYQVKTLIHGHTHRPEVHQLDQNKQRIVLGDWWDNLWWIETSAEGFELLSQPIQRK
jgi:UDP-2,3-diacylglucosamine hydrolase